LASATFVQADWKSDMFQQGTTLYENAKHKTVELYKELKPLADDQNRSKEAHMNTIWDELLPQLEKGLEYTDKLEKAPESSWIGSDKKDIQHDIDKVFNKIIDTLIDDDFLSYKKEINSLQQDIFGNKNTIAFYREKKISAPAQSSIKTTKADYAEKIEELQEENRNNARRIEQIKGRLIEQFADIGVDLTPEQINVLLTRVDGDDIIQMALMMDVLKHITEQIMVLMKENNEDLNYAKKYYGLHLVTLELVVYIQQNYINKVDHVYIPKIDNIMFEAQKMVAETKRLAASEMSGRRRNIYEKNIQTQELTAHVAQLYKQDLITSKISMVNAQRITKKNLDLARNTYKTVVLSADLYELISESQNMFSEVSKIQVPNIIPFENMQIQKKYYELTKLIQKK
jgi:gas vesicle protein